MRSGNCLVVFHNPFFPFQPLFKLTKISLKFTFTPALISEIVFPLKRGIVMFQGAKNLAVNHLPLELGLAVQT